MGKGCEFNLQEKSGWKSSRCSIAVYGIVNPADGYLHCKCYTRTCCMQALQWLKVILVRIINISIRRARWLYWSRQEGSGTSWCSSRRWVGFNRREAASFPICWRFEIKFTHGRRMGKIGGLRWGLCCLFFKNITILEGLYKQKFPDQVYHFISLVRALGYIVVAGRINQTAVWLKTSSSLLENFLHFLVCSWNTVISGWLEGEV